MAEMNMDPEIIAIFKEQSKKYLATINNALVMLEKQGVSEELYRQIKAVLHTLKGDSRMLGLAQISAAVHSLEDLFMPRNALQAQASQPEGLENIGFVYATLDQISAAVEKIPEIVEIDIDDAPGKPLEKKPETESRPPEAIGQPAETAKTFAEGETRFVKKDAGGAVADAQETELLTLDIKKIEDMIGMSSIFPRYSSRLSYLHLHLTQAREELGSLSDARLENTKKRFDSLLYELGHELSFFDLQSRQFQDDITRLKLVQLRSLFDQFPRLVRDVAQSTGKRVNFVVQGRDVELEKIVVDNLKPILIHLLRNAVDHGAQKEEERIGSGKSGENRVLLNAFNHGDNVIIEISDDGRGLDLWAIRKTAIQKGYLSAENAEKLSDEMVISYIFESGFSTKAVGDFSGRGVGMDAVAQTVKSLNGEIDVRTIAGKGTTFSIKLPLFSSYIPVTLFSLGGILYGIPSVYIQSVIPYVQSDVSMVGEKSALVHTAFGEVSLIDLGTLFGFGKNEEVKTPVILILKYKDSLVCLVVDEIVMEKKLIIRKTLALSHHLKIVIGAVLLGKERAIPVINVPELFSELLHRDVTFVRDEHYLAGKQKFGAKTILLVEDSPVTRLREKQILLNQNLNVIEAANGREALEILKKQEPDCIITDLEMPVLNGPAFIKECKKDPKLAAIPVIVVSSYDNLADDVFALGINYFINKAEFSAELMVNVLKGQKVL